jgi:ferrous iron transport protein A
MSSVAAPNETSMSGQQLPLSFLRSGETARVLRVRGKGETAQHLRNLGFVEGSNLRVVSEQSGNIIVEVKGVQVALNKQAASKIVTCA